MAKSQELHLKITQHHLPYGNKYSYSVNDSVINISCKGDYCEEDDLLVPISEKGKRKILDELSVINFANLDSVYSIPMIDGTYWQFKTPQKSIYVENCFVNELDRLLEALNALIPKSHHWISMTGAPKRN